MSLFLLKWQLTVCYAIGNKRHSITNSEFHGRIKSTQWNGTAKKALFCCFDVWYVLVSNGPKTPRAALYRYIDDHRWRKLAQVCLSRQACAVEKARVHQSFRQRLCFCGHGCSVGPTSERGPRCSWKVRLCPWNPSGRS